MVSLAADSLYQMIGGTPAVVAALVGLVITIVVSRYYANKGKITKALGWTPLGVTPIVTRPVHNLSRGLALTWNGEPLQTPFAVSIRITNVGSREIIGPRKDYLEAFSVEFDGTCYEAITKASSKTRFTGATSILPAPAASFEVPMPTLNSGDWVELACIVDGSPHYPRMRTVLLGQTSLLSLVAGKARSRMKNASAVVFVVGYFLLTLGFGLLGYQSLTLVEGPTLLPITLVVIGGLAVVAAGGLYFDALLLDRSELRVVKRGLSYPSTTRTTRVNSNTQLDVDQD
jgi:hypothetical protein